MFNYVIIVSLIKNSAFRVAILQLLLMIYSLCKMSQNIISYITLKLITSLQFIWYVLDDKNKSLTFDLLFLLIQIF